MERQEISAGSSRGGYGSTEARVPEVDFSGFNPTEFYNLCESITTNIYTINQSWKQLDEALKLLGTDRDSAGLRDKM
jgi:hypothetical protein